MLKIYSGDRKTIQEQLKQLSNETNLPIKYTQDIFSELEKQYGFFFSPAIIYFIYDDKDFNKDNIKKFDKLATTTKSIIVCVIETEPDKRGSFYKQYSKKILSFNKPGRSKTQKIRDIPANEAISFLYKMFYNNQYKAVAGECINLVLTGKIKTENILQIFILREIDKNLCLTKTI